MYSKIEPKNVLNYNQYTSFNYTHGVSIASKNTTVVSFNNIQLNQVPQKMIIFARKPDSALTSYDSNSFMVIKGVSINFGNKSGLLSSANQQQLYDMSCKNGVAMNYYEYAGTGVSNNLQGVPENVPTIGSILALDPAIDLSIDTQFSNGSAGQFNVQFDLTLYNQSDEDFAPTLYFMVVNSGIFVTESGQSTFTTGLLNQEVTLETKSQEAITDSHTYDKTIVGGSIENIGGIHKHLKGAFSKVTEKEKTVDEGAGMSAAGMSGGNNLPSVRKRITKYSTN